MKKQDLVFDKFQKFWEELDEQEQRALWDVMSALRGPDSMVDSIKYLTTSRIRALFIWGNKKVEATTIKGAYAFNTLTKARRHCGDNPLTPKEVRQILVKGCHFKDHVFLALNALGKRYPVKVKSIKKSIGWK